MMNHLKIDRRTVIVGMSGGVDSSVAALLLREQGYEVRGLFMRNWRDEQPDTHCTADQDAQDALQVCDTLGIELDGVDFSAEYWERVFEHFLAEYRGGRTPNPDILCNKEIKFRAFLDHAIAQGADYIATGHYAGVRAYGGIYELYTPRDRDKDQSYFLYTLGQNQLARTLFPLAGLTKVEVRRIAAARGFANHDKRDSTGICFIGERDFRRFLQRYLPALPGDVRTPEGDLMGRHDGLMYYTLGQRKGIGIGGRRGSNGQPWYVVGKDLETNTLRIAQGHGHPLLLSRTLEAESLHWVKGAAPQATFSCKAKVRYRQIAQPCHVSMTEEGQCSVTFARAQWAVTPGQSIVFYQADNCLGGGVIAATRPITMTTPSSTAEVA